jgi:flavin-binding protein dodecin
MGLVKVIEVLAESPKSWEDAAEQAVREASKTLHGVRSVYVKEMTATVRGDKIESYRLDLNLSFEVDDRERGEPRRGTDQIARGMEAASD